MRKIAFLIVLCCLMPVKSWAWRDNPAAIKAVTALFHNLESTEKVKQTFRLKVNNGEIVVLPFLFCLS